MKRVTGLGGIFIKAKDPDALREWYRRHLGIAIEPWGGAVFADEPGSVSVWNLFPADSDYFVPSAAPFMVNYRVADLRALLEVLRAEGCAVDAKTEESEFGRFGWVMDPEGNRVELWEPPPGPLPG